MLKNKSILIVTLMIILLLFLGLQTNISIANSEVKLDDANFPDENFRYAIETEYQKFTADGILTKEEIEEIKSLDISMNNIKNLKGIEYFTNLKYLNASVNQLQNLDLSKNTEIRTLDLSNNQTLESLQLPDSVENVYLNFNDNLENLNISDLRNLKLFSAEDVPLGQIELKNLTELISLNLFNTGLTSIDVSNNKKLEYLNVSENNLTVLNLVNNTELVTLRAVNNKLEKIYFPNSNRNNTVVEFYSQKVNQGYEIKWYEQNNLINEKDEIKMSGQLLTSKINAKLFNIVYNANGGKGSMSTISHVFGEAVKLNTNGFTRTGYQFKGWALSSNGSVKYINQDTIQINEYPKNGKLNLYAVWSPIKYSIEFDANGGSGKTEEMLNLNYGENYRLNKNKFIKEGYTFKGWTNIKESNVIKFYDGSSISNLTSNEGETVKLYAVWQKNSYTISLNANGGVLNNSQSIKKEHGSKLSLNNPSRTGYTFLGWFDSKTNEKFDFNSQITKSISLVAKWKANNYYVVLNGNGSTKNNAKSYIVEYNQTFRLPDNTYVKNNYEFLGWSLTPNGRVLYKDKALIKNLSSKDKDTVVLYAQWKFIKKEFNISSKDVQVIYDGKAHSIKLNNVPSGSKIEYRTSKSDNWSTIKPARTNVGITTIYYKVTNSEYNTIEGSRKIIIDAKQIKNLNISNISNKTYTGKQIKPSVTIKDGNKVLKNGTHYSLSYGSNKSTGKAYVKINGKGNYAGTITKYFYIIPKKPTIKASSAKNSITVTAKSTGASGYEISYATSKNGKYKTVRTSSQKRKITKLVKSKRYYIKVRAYKIIDGKRVYSSYSMIRI